MTKSPTGSILSLRQGLSLGILIIFIVAIEYYFGWVSLLKPWALLDGYAIILAVMLVFLSYALRAKRLSSYFQAETKGQFALCFKLMLQHNLLNNLLPMRTGEISFPVLMQRYFSLPMKRSIPALLWFRLLDLHTLAIFALLALDIEGLTLPMKSAILLIWLTIPWILFKFNGHFSAQSNPEHPSAIIKKINQVMVALDHSPQAFLRTWGWTLVNWSIKIAVYAWILAQFIDLTPYAAWMGSIAGELTSILPIHGIAGAGTYEAGVIAGLTPYGHNLEDALLAAVNLHLFLLSATLLSGLLSLLIRSPKHHE